jgi:hypothetical protein
LELVNVPALDAKFCSDALPEPSLVFQTEVCIITEVWVVGLPPPPPPPPFANAIELIATNPIITNAFMLFPFRKFFVEVNLFCRSCLSELLIFETRSLREILRSTTRGKFTNFFKMIVGNESFCD